jgi:hypothetical protein
VNVYFHDVFNLTTVCSEEFNKCYHLRTTHGEGLDAMMLYDTVCKDRNSFLVNLKSLKEQQLVRGLLLDYYLFLAKSYTAYKSNPSDAYTLIGKFKKTQVSRVSVIITDTGMKIFFILEKHF